MNANSQSAEELTQHAEFLRALAQRLLGNEADGDDLVQEAYLAALQAPAKSIRSPKRWLAHVLRRKSSNRLRGLRNRAQRESDAAKREVTPSDEELSERLEASKLLLAAVDRLGAEQRRVIYLRYYEGLSIERIASLDRLKLETVRSRQRRALEQLRACMDRGDAATKADWMQALMPLACARPELSKALSVGSWNAAHAAIALGGAFVMKKWLMIVLVGSLLIGGRLFLGAEFGGRLNHGKPGPSGASLQTQGAELEPGMMAGVGVRERGAPLGREGVAGPVSNSLSRIVVKLKWEADGAPAVGVELLLYSIDPEQPAAQKLDRSRGRSNAEGQVSFGGLPAGVYQLRGFRGGQSEVILKPGDSLLVELSIPSGVDVEGIVLDPEGLPIAGAEVWLGEERNGLVSASLAAHTDDAGRYSLRSVNRRLSVSARTERHGPSIRVQLESKRSHRGEPLLIELQMRAIGGVLEGDVFDAAGNPLADALVCVGDPGRQVGIGNGRTASVSPPLMARSNDQGHFRLVGIEVGRRQVSVKAEAHAILDSTVEIAAERTTHSALHLVRGYSVTGIIRDGRGVPVEGALVQPVRSMQQSQPFSCLPVPSSFSDRSGRYQLKNLRIAGLPLEARLIAYANIRLGAIEGDSLVWNPVLDSVDEIRGRLLDAEGEALEDWLVEAYCETDQTGLGHPRWANTDASGNFAIRVEIGEPYALSARYAQTPDAVQRSSKPLAAGVTASFDPIELRVDRGRWGKIRGQIVDPAGMLGPQEVLRVEALDMFTSVLSQEVVDGAFSIGPLPPGSYRLVFRVGSQTLHTSELVELDGKAGRDLGTLVMTQMGSVRLTFTRGPGVLTDQSNISVMLIDFVSMKSQGLELRDGAYVSSDVLPGSYDLVVLADQVAAYHPRISVQATKETSMHVLFEAAVNVAFLFDLSAVNRLVGGLNIRVEKITGERYADIRLDSAKDLQVMPFSWRLSKGHWRISLVHDSGASQTADLILSDLSQVPPEPILLRLE